MRLLFFLLLELGVMPALAQVRPPHRNGGRRHYAAAKTRLSFPPKYDGTEPLQNGMVRVRRESSYGYLDAAGREVVPVRFAAVADTDTPESYALAKRVVPGWAQRDIRLPPHLILVVDFVPALVQSPADVARQRPNPRPEDEYRLGLYRPDGREVLPAKYAYIRAIGPFHAGSGADSLTLTSDCFAAGILAGYAGYVTHGGCMVTYHPPEPYYREQLLHRSGRLLLSGKQVAPIKWLSRDLVGIGNLMPGAYSTGGACIVLDTTGRQVMTGRSITPFGKDDRLMVDRDRSQVLLRRDGTPVTNKLFTYLQALDSTRAIAHAYVLGSVGHEDYGSARTRYAVPLPLAGLLDLATGNWLLTPRYESMRPVGEGFVVVQHGSEGTADQHGELVIPPTYKRGSLHACHDSASGQPLPYWLAYQRHKALLLDCQGRKLLAWPLSLTPRDRHGFFNNGQMFLQPSNGRRARKVVVALPPPGGAGHAVLRRATE
ncbi:WG repeat-containing protein [Hymenobacter properus]|uniref:WG repeat-containing protein n=1 Tax=Hymenobacter properus TaxID=2791026 RepID=A0A931BDA6_9BACT|nr:WG repeat-containing protein [Hymenobacter properus]MBF9141770.1 WG repeat-containing protein [Hymenobacter properus]MBR7720579.1 WG repeat-containing protein [Microvirga sp. SRT04]